MEAVTFALTGYVPAALPPGILNTIPIIPLDAPPAFHVAVPFFTPVAIVAPNTYAAYVVHTSLAASASNLAAAASDASSSSHHPPNPLSTPPHPAAASDASSSSHHPPDPLPIPSYPGTISPNAHDLAATATPSPPAQVNAPNPLSASAPPPSA